jgi:L-seryl-tRNA(Ser) seleniumtransferase
MSKSKLQKIPSVDLLLEHPKIKSTKENFSLEFIKYCIHTTIDQIRIDIKKGVNVPAVDEIVVKVLSFLNHAADVSLKKVINATGIILHTNLGRAPLGEKIFNEIRPALSGYSNLEFDLNSAKRGKRTDHLIDLLKFLAGAESAVVVNNNAAAVSLVLRTLCEGKETIISRGELIEIGGSFRLPEIMAASGTKMIEVGTTNRTRISDYQKAITKNTAAILKVHKSNFTIEGFSEEVGLKVLASLVKQKKIILIYDVGSGLIVKPDKTEFELEPLVKKSFADSADIVTFSCDKLLGGPQAGIIAGKKKLIEKISKHPLIRTYRVDKLTIALLTAVLKSYLMKNNDLLLIKMLNRSNVELKSLAEKLVKEFEKLQIKSNLIESETYCGGGSLPNVKFKSYSVVLNLVNHEKNFAQSIYKKLLLTESPVLSILRKGEIHFDMFTLFEEDLPTIALMIKKIL